MADDSKRRAAPRSTWADETRQKQRDWQKQNRYKLSADVDRQTGLLFKDYCVAQGRSVSAVLADYIYSIVGRPEDRRAAPPASDPTDLTDGDRRTGGPEAGSPGDSGQTGSAATD